MHQQQELARELAVSFGQLRRAVLKGKPVDDLRPSEFQFLAALDVLCGNERKGHGVKISAVSSAFRITQAAATHKLKVLAERGYVTRMESADDRRITLVRPTVKGERLVAEEEERYLQVFAGLAEHLGAADGNELQRLLARTLVYFEQEDRAKKRHTGIMESSE